MGRRDSMVLRISLCAVVGAAYAALTLLLAPISYGLLQLRLSEILCILPYFIPSTAWGLFAGCAFSNIITGNVFDVIFGSLATLASGLITARLGQGKHSTGSCFMACTANVFINALVVGSLITAAYNGLSIGQHLGIFAMNCLYIAIGEGAVMYIIALPLMKRLPQNRYFAEFTDKFN